MPSSNLVLRTENKSTEHTLDDSNKNQIFEKVNSQSKMSESKKINKSKVKPGSRVKKLTDIETPDQFADAELLDAKSENSLKILLKKIHK